MKYNLIFEISPPAIFGVPEDGTTVLPSKNIEYISDTYYRNMRRVGYGTLSKYRTKNQAVKLSITLGNAKAKFDDNYMFLEVESESMNHAYSMVISELDKFFRNLSLNQRRIFTYRNIVIEDENGQIWRVPDPITISSISFYSIKGLKSNIKKAEKYHNLNDKKLEKALEYFEQSLLLFEKRGLIANISSRLHKQVVASIFLNFAKAVTTILGDKRIDKDHNSRYLQLGLNKEFYLYKVKPIYKLRNNYDVAHYSLTDEKNKEIEKQIGDTKSTVSEVIEKYRDYLWNKQQELNNQDSETILE